MAGIEEMHERLEQIGQQIRIAETAGNTARAQGLQALYERLQPEYEAALAELEVRVARDLRRREDELARLLVQPDRDDERFFERLSAYEQFCDKVKASRFVSNSVLSLSDPKARVKEAKEELVTV